MNLNLKPANECAFDAVSLGEVMLRFDPGEGRIRTARSFRAWEGGGEYNVVRGLRRCFGLKTAVIQLLLTMRLVCLWKTSFFKVALTHP